MEDCFEHGDLGDGVLHAFPKCNGRAKALTGEILGREQDRSQMVLCDQRTNLRSHRSAIEA